jgi:ferredoxin
MQHNKHVQNKKCADLLGAVVEADLCNGCGTCVVICPSNLRMKLNLSGEHVPEAHAE